MPLVMHSEREMSGQIGESDPTVPSRKWPCNTTSALAPTILVRRS